MYEQIKKTLSVKSVVTLVVILSLVFGLALRFICYPIFLLLTPEFQNRNMANKVFKYLNNEEVEGLSELFCPAAKCEAYFQHDIQNLFSRFDGEITDESWKIIRETTSFVYSNDIDHGRLTKMGWKTSYVDIVTTSGEAYTLFLSWYLINDENPEYEGIKSFAIVDGSDYIGVVTDG